MHLNDRLSRRRVLGMGSGVAVASVLAACDASSDAPAPTSVPGTPTNGCGFFGTFRWEMLPLGAPIIVTVCIMQTIYTWNSFLVPLVFTLNDSSLRPLSVGMFAFQGEFSRDLTGSAAGGAIGIIPIIIVFLLLQRNLIAGIAGAVKG